MSIRTESVEQVDCVVIGAGVVGLAIARALQLDGCDVLVLEANDRAGAETSSRNSEVIHAGIYYRRDSLMARLCVRGRRQLYAYCSERRIPHRACGKLIVATTPAEAMELKAIKARAEANGVERLELLSGSQALALEPALACEAALLSPVTGIIDGDAYMRSLLGDAENGGAAIAFLSPVIGGRVEAGRIELDVGGRDPMRLRARLVVNAAGLWAPGLARAFAGFPSHHVPRAYYAKGNYFTCAGRSPFSRLIYPVPVPGGLGVHLTLDLGGQMKFGPDVEWVDDIDYAVDPARGQAFYAAIRRYWPALPDGALQPGYAGIRPKIVPPGAPAQDFVVQTRIDHGVSGIVNLFGIESPGLTSSLAIADYVLERVRSEAA